MIKPKNPFVIGKYVSPDYFCDRAEETRMLKHHVSNGRNVVIMSERRLGKTGLIEHLMEQPDICKEYYCFFIDIFAMHNLREMVCELANEIYSRLSVRQQNFAQRFSNFVRSIQTSFSFEQLSGAPQISFSLGDIERPEASLDELLACLEAADRTCLVAIDEFQQVTEFEEDNMEALLRTKIQHLKNVQFIFAGSKKHLREGIFDSPDRPFYNSVVFMKLDPIAEDAYVNFACRLFTKGGKELDETLVRKAYHYFNGVTWYLQLFMNEAYGLTERGGIAAESDFDEILQHIIDIKRFTFEETYARLTEKQKAVVRAIAAEWPKAASPTSTDFIQRHKLKTASSVQTALRGLAEKGIVRDDTDRHQISDLLFALWLKQRG